MTRVALLVAVCGVVVLLVAATIYAAAHNDESLAEVETSVTTPRAPVRTTPPSRTPPVESEPLEPTFESDVDVPEPAAEPLVDIGAVLAAAGVTAEPTEHPKQLVDGAPLWSIPAEPGYPAADVWLQLRDVYPQTGWWPVLVNESSFYGIGPEGLALPADWESTPLDGKRWLESRYEDVVARYDEPVVRGPMPEFEAAADGFDWADAWDVVGADYDRILLVPTRAPWLVPAVLRWSGATNYDENGADLANVLRRWYGRWSAEIVALDQDELALRVGDPPDDAATALRVALEAFLTCTDSVDQGAGTLDALAPAMALPLWRFWWD